MVGENEDGKQYLFNICVDQNHDNFLSLGQFH